MIIRKLRLRRGWSQEQLAELAGLSTRTIQRIERGQSCSLETLKSLAAVFEVDIATFRPQERYVMSLENPHISTEEHDAIDQVQRLKSFYTHGVFFVLFCLIFGGIVLLSFGEIPAILLFMALGWSLGLAFQGLNAFELFNLFNARWERRQIEKRLGRRL